MYNTAIVPLEGVPRGSENPLRLSRKRTERRAQSCPFETTSQRSGDTRHGVQSKPPVWAVRATGTAQTTA